MSNSKELKPTTNAKVGKETEAQAPNLEPVKAKTTAEKVEEQKAYFAKKNEQLKKLSIFENKGKELGEVLEIMREEAEEELQDVFSNNRSYRLSIYNHSREICSIQTTVVIQYIIKAVLSEIEKNRHSLELELLKD